MQGYNGTVFASGQTGTGKTYTMEGGSGPDSPGVIPLSFQQIFAHVTLHSSHQQFLVRPSCPHTLSRHGFCGRMILY